MALSAQSTAYSNHLCYQHTGVWVEPGNLWAKQDDPCSELKIIWNDDLAEYVNTSTSGTSSAMNDSQATSYIIIILNQIMKLPK